MATVLFITANPKAKENSYSLSVAAEFLQAYRAEHPRDQIVELDLYKKELPFIDVDVFNGWGKLQQGKGFEELSDKEQRIVGQINELTEQFVAADKYIFVTPMWNLSIPPLMKAYLDTICVAGKTFRYTANGPVGMLTDKSGIHIQARGGVYTEGPARDMEFGDRYIRALLSFLGVKLHDSIIAEGMDQTPDQAQQIKAKAIERAREAAKRF